MKYSLLRRRIVSLFLALILVLSSSACSESPPMFVSAVETDMEDEVFETDETVTETDDTTEEENFVDMEEPDDISAEIIDTEDEDTGEDMEEYDPDVLTDEFDDDSLSENSISELEESDLMAFSDAVPFAVNSSSDLGTGTGTQRDTDMGNNTVFAMDKWLSDKTGELNDQNTYDIYLEQGLFNNGSSSSFTSPAPSKSNVILIIDQSSSMSSGNRVNVTNNSTKAFFTKIKALNDARMRKATNGEFSDINMNGNVRQQMQEHLICVTGIVGFNNHVYQRYRNSNGLPVDSDEALNTLISAAHLNNNSTDMQTMTATWMGLEQAEQWLREDGDLDHGYVVMITDGEPTSRDTRGWDYDMVDANGNAIINMSSTSANKALTSARRMKDAGTYSETVWVDFDTKRSVEKALSSGDIRDVTEMPGVGARAIFMSMVSSDYPKNGTFGTNGRKFSGTFSFENDPRNRFGENCHFVYSKIDLQNNLVNIAPKINMLGYDMDTKYNGMTSYVQDVISDPFEKMSSRDVQVFKVPRVPANLDDNGVPTDLDPSTHMVSSFTWGSESYTDPNNPSTALTDWIEITDEVVVSVTENMVKVSGFDYESNAITCFDKDYGKTGVRNPEVYSPGDYGYKLVVKIPINARVSFGGNGILTNNPDTSYFYPSKPKYLPAWPDNKDLNPDGNMPIDWYPVPSVDLEVKYKIVSDSMRIYAPQTVDLMNLITNKDFSQWYIDDLYMTLKLQAESDLMVYKQLQSEYEAFEKICGDSPEDDARLMELEQAAGKAYADYENAKSQMLTNGCYMPDGHNNQFVDIHYSFKDPDGIEIATLDIPHGTAYTGSNGVSYTGSDLKYNMVGGEHAIITKSGTYTITATVSPVDTSRAPDGHIYSASDAAETKSGRRYSSLEYSSTGSYATGSAEPLTLTENPEAYLFQLEVTATDTRLMPRQTLDFYEGSESLYKTKNPHIKNYRWACTDGVTESIKADEPGVTGELIVGNGDPIIISNVPQRAYDEKRAIDIMGTHAVGDIDGSYVPVGSYLSRQCGDLNKYTSSIDSVTQTDIAMTDSDNIWGAGQHSVIWKHLCDAIEDCDGTCFAEAQGYSGIDGQEPGKVRYLIHAEANPKPEIHKTTSTPSISKGDDIKWNIQLTNTSEKENPRHLASDFDLVDVLPYNGDHDRIDPFTNHEGSKFSGELKYTSILFDLSNAPILYGRLKDGDSAVYLTTDKNVRTATEEQILGQSATNSISWTKAELVFNDDDQTVSVTNIPEEAYAFRLSGRMKFGGEISADLSANMRAAVDQEIGDYYHNRAVVYNGNGGRYSETVATKVSYLSIRGSVWEDIDANGLMDAQEERIQGAVATLYKEWNPNNGGQPDRVVGNLKLSQAFSAAHNKIPPYATEDDGSFHFDNVQHGTFYIIVDQIPEKYAPTKKQAGMDEGSRRLDSECEESFISTGGEKGCSAMISKVVVNENSVDYQNVGLKMILGNIKVWKSLNEIYYPTTMTAEEIADYQLVFLFKLRNTATGRIYKKTVRLNSNTFGVDENGKPQVYAEFDSLPLGTYELTEMDEAQYQLDSFEAISGNGMSYNAGQKTMTINITPNEHEFEVHAKNVLIQEPPGGDENGLKNWINIRIPVKLELTYVGPDPISSPTLTTYKFSYSDFDPAKGGNMVVTYDDGTQISLKDGTLRFEDVTLTPTTVTNAMNSGINKVGVSGYYSERGRTVTDAFKVAVDLKPIHKFQLNFDANSSSFDNGASMNIVYFTYDDNTGHNYVTMGEYKDGPNGKLKILPGFRFTGWNTRSDGMGVNYDDITALDAIGRDPTIDTLTLYARWTTDITFVGNTGVLAGGRTAAEAAIRGRTQGSIPCNLHQNVSTSLVGSRSDYSFVCWNTNVQNMVARGTDVQDYGECKGPVTFYGVYYHSLYGYTGSPQLFRVPVNGRYKIQCWGARGGYDDYNDGSVGGHGGYAEGQIWLTAGTELWMYVGNEGRDEATGTGAGYNGGADSGPIGWSGGGGGATSLSTVYGWWSDSAVLNNRLIVAGGGGGGGNHCVGYPAGYGGGPWGRGESVTPDGGGGGGGYYGGRGGWGDTAGYGGSNYVSPRFTNAVTRWGNQTMPSVNGGTQVGNNGPCYARIELMSRSQ